MKFGEFHLANGHLDDVVFIIGVGKESKRRFGCCVGRERKQRGDEYGERKEEYDDMQSTMREGKRSRTKTPEKCVHILREFLLTTKRPRKK